MSCRLSLGWNFKFFSFGGYNFFIDWIGLDLRWTDIVVHFPSILFRQTYRLLLFFSIDLFTISIILQSLTYPCIPLSSKTTPYPNYCSLWLTPMHCPFLSKLATWMPLCHHSVLFHMLYSFPSFSTCLDCYVRNLIRNGCLFTLFPTRLTTVMTPHSPWFVPSIMHNEYSM